MFPVRIRVVNLLLAVDSVARHLVLWLQRIRGSDCMHASMDGVSTSTHDIVCPIDLADLIF